MRKIAACVIALVALTFLLPTSAVADPSNYQKVKITVMGINARGTDTLANRNSEYVWMRNVSGADVNVFGWKLIDAAGNTTSFTDDTLPNLTAGAGTLTLPAGASIIVYSGQGIDTTPDNNVHAIYRNGKHYINNTSGETMRVLDKDGSTVELLSFDAYGINPTP